jgi:hypothetical protein
MKKYLCIVPLALLVACDRLPVPQERVVVVQQPVERVVVVERPVERIVERQVVVERPSIIISPRMERRKPCEDAPRVYRASGTISWLGADWSGGCIENVKFTMNDDGCSDNGRMFFGSARCIPELKCIHDEYQRSRRGRCGIRVRIQYTINECGEARIIGISRC